MPLTGHSAIGLVTTAALGSVDADPHDDAERDSGSPGVAPGAGVGEGESGSGDSGDGRPAARSRGPSGLASSSVLTTGWDDSLRSRVTAGVPRVSSYYVSMPDFSIGHRPAAGRRPSSIFDDTSATEGEGSGPRRGTHTSLGDIAGVVELDNEDASDLSSAFLKHGNTDATREYVMNQYWVLQYLLIAVGVYYKPAHGVTIGKIWVGLLAIFAWWPVVALVLGLTGVYPCSDKDNFPTIYGVLFATGVALCHNTGVYFFRTRAFEGQLLRLPASQHPRLARRCAMFMLTSMAVYVLPRVFWDPEQPYYTYLFQLLPDGPRLAVGISRVYGDVATVAVCFTLYAASNVHLRMMDAFLVGVVNADDNVDAWSIIDQFRRLYALCDQMSADFAVWLGVHFCLMAVVAAIEIYDVIQVQDTSVKDDLIPLAPVVKDATLLLFVLALPLFVVARTTSYYGQLERVLNIMGREDLPTALHDRKNHFLVVDAIGRAGGGFRLAGLLITPAKAATVLLVTMSGVVRQLLSTKV